jgi:hypothetical protein
MSLPQIQAALRACDRRDAMLALQHLETTHAGNAPLLVGKEGRTAFEKCAGYLRNIIAPKSAKSTASTVFKKLFALARNQDIERKVKGIAPAGSNPS